MEINLTIENRDGDRQTSRRPLCRRIHIGGVHLTRRRNLTEPSLAAGERGVAPTQNRVVIQEGCRHDIGTSIEGLASAELGEGRARISKD